MNKSIMRLLPLFILMSTTGLLARELRTPWSLGLYNGHMHVPLPRPVDGEEGCYTVDVWGAGLHRESNAAYRNDHGTKKDKSLAGIIFGKDEFVGLDAFAPGTIAPCNPFLATSMITPHISYSENSAYFGFTVERPFGCNQRWRGGVRALLPFRSIKTSLEDCCDLEEDIDLSDVCRLQDEHVPVPGGEPQRVYECYAYRLDFLSSLFIEQAGSDLERLVKYNDGGLIKINNVDVTDMNGRPVYVTQRDDETAPEGLFCKLNTEIAALPCLANDGSGLANDADAVFCAANDYTALGNDTAQQRQLWVQPAVGLNIPGDPTSNLQMDGAARNIGDAINTIVRKINTSATDFFAEHGVNFNTHHVVGLGDLDTQFYLNYEWCRGLVEGTFGMRWPTGVKTKDSGNLLSIFSTGNNRHFEMSFGFMGTWEPNNWFIFKGDAYYAHAFKHGESVGAPFAGATVKNIGPRVNADISWNYFVMHADFNFLVPCNPCVGFMAGYEFYAKSKDKVSLKQTTATDFLGHIQSLDANVLESRTKVLAHKFRSEFFHQGDNFQIYGGWTHVFAGKNAPNESDWHLGFVTYF